jgi:hypothetical protein
MDPSQPAGSRRRTTAIIAAAGLACLAIAIPVSGAFGADDSTNNGAAPSAQQQGGQGYGQPPGADGYGQPPGGQRGPDGDCPKGEGGGQSQDDSGESSAPALPDDSIAL